LHSETGAPEARTAGDAALYVVATPLGNLQDVTLRALDVLKRVDLIAAEDTRVTRRLLQHYAIGKRTISLRRHNEARAAQRVLALLRAGRSVALVSDAGTPAISDPGALLVNRVRAAGARVVPVPGPSALAAALSVAGLEDGQFLFLGFLPAQRSARRSALEAVRTLPFALVVFEAPHRVRETVADLAALLAPQRRLTIARELTKLFESVHACALAEAEAWLDADADRLRGEFVLIVERDAAAPAASEQVGERVLDILLAELPLKQAVQLAARITGAKRNELYRRALAVKAGPDRP
jgi:16S rRNA (cytidine1402-2'-O)-methyltransferase